jgi:hypothetical protein
MKFALRILAVFAFVCGLGSLIIGLSAWHSRYQSGPPEPLIAVSPNAAAVGELPLGEHRLVSFNIRNRSGTRTVRLLGAEDFCSPAGCVRSACWPLSLPPGGAATVEIDFSGQQAGSFTCAVPMYTDSPGQTQVSLTIIGEILAPASAKGGQPNPVSP